MRVTTAIIGLGYWGPNLLRNFAATEGCSVKYACDLADVNIDKQKGRYPAVTYTKNVDDILNDDEVDLVVIATPTASHYPLAKQVLEANKHVFIEKPMTETSEQAKVLCTLADDKKKMIFVDHTFVFTEAVKKIARLANDGFLGDLLYFNSSRINLGLIQKDCNVIWDLAVHDLSIISSFKDLDNIETVTAIGSAHYGEQVEVGHLHLRFTDGFNASIHVSWLSPVKIRHTMLGGSKAMVTYDDTEPSEKIRIYDKGVDHDNTRSDPFFPKYRAGDITIPALQMSEALGTEAAHVIRCIRYGELPIVSGNEGRKIVRVLEKANESLECANPVSFL